MLMDGVWVVVPIKEVAGAKQRLAGILSARVRSRLALTMAEDVLSVLSTVQGLAGLAVVSCDPQAIQMAARFGARILSDDARGGHTAAVRGAARVLADEGRKALLTMPGDIPLVTAAEVEQVLAAATGHRDFVIAPAHDGRGSNAILCAPPDIVPLSFGDDSFIPHLATARACGIEPQIVRAPGIALDIDNPQDLAAFMQVPSRTRTFAMLRELGLTPS
jgi:2-phospho-L-lactate/phosphoenolpyruvate guanylyltransferase